MRAVRTIRATLLAGMLVGAVALTGCGAGQEPLPLGTTDVELSVGETAQVALGEWSPGVGDGWGVVSQTDEAVLEAVDVFTGGRVFGETERDLGDGASLPHAVEVTGAARGVSTVRVIYCYRDTIVEGCDQGPRDIEPIEITVAVE